MPIPLPPFKAWLASNIPSVFDNTLSYYEELTKLIAYLEQVVVPAVNENEEKVAELDAAFIELKGFVEHYFDNLDVQEEINNKLDEMVEDGTMTEILNETIFPTIKKIIADTTNPIYYGADPSGVEDSTQAINDCIAANKGGAINFSTGTYLVSNSINLPFKNSEKVSINGNGAKLVAANETFTNFIHAGYDRTDSELNDVGFICYIKDLEIDCSNGTVTNAIYNEQGFKDLHILNCNTYRTTNGVKIGTGSGSPADVLIENCIIYGNGSEYAGVGVQSNATDNYINDTRIYGFQKGVEVINGSAAVIDNTHVLLRWHDQTQSNFNPYPIDGAEFAEYYPQTIGFDIKGAFRSSNIYSDSMCIMAKIDTTSEVTFINAKHFNARTGVEMHAFDVLKRDPKLSIIGAALQFRAGNGKEISGLRIVNGTPTFNIYAQVTIKDILITGISNMTNPFDLILDGYTQKEIPVKSMLANTWYIAGVVANWTSGDYRAITVNIDGWNYLHRMSGSAIQQFAADTDNATNYTIGTFIENNKLFVCVKTSSAGDHSFGIEIGKGKSIAFNIYPTKNESIANSSRLLSDYTATVPTLTKTLYQDIGRSTT